MKIKTTLKKFLIFIYNDYIFIIIIKINTVNNIKNSYYIKNNNNNI